MPPANQPETIRPALAVQVDGEASLARQAATAVEAPLELRLNGRSHTLLMVTPDLVEELARGYCLSEGLANRPDQVLGISLGQGQLPGLGLVLWADVHLDPELARRAKVRRVAPAATSCGLCGLQSLDDLGGVVPPVPAIDIAVECAALRRLLAAMEQGQTVFPRTGGAHAVALGNLQGDLLAMAEDVGRHNALDKALGLALRAGRDPSGCLAILSGRISYEMALKAARAGLPLVASVSAPTSLGVALLARLGLTGVGFLRGQRLTVYSHPWRLRLEGKPLPSSEFNPAKPDQS